MFKFSFSAKQALTAHPNRWRKLRFNVASLDRLLCTGGISARGVVEISGDAGSGKTQLALHLALTCQQQCPERRGVVYISTEHPFPSKRLVQMEQTLRNSSGVGHEVGKYSDNIFVEHLNNPVGLDLIYFEDLLINNVNSTVRAGTMHHGSASGAAGKQPDPSAGDRFHRGRLRRRGGLRRAGGIVPTVGPLAARPPGAVRFCHRLYEPGPGRGGWLRRRGEGHSGARACLGQFGAHPDSAEADYGDEPESLPTVVLSDGGTGRVLLCHRAGRDFGCTIVLRERTTFLFHSCLIVHLKYRIYT